MSAPEISPTPTPIAIAVVEQARCYLVGQRSSGVALAGYDEFPGGKVEPGETAEAAAIRECEEETGLAVRVLRLLADYVHEYPHGRVRLQFFLCEPAGAEVVPRDPYRWIPRGELASLRFPEGNRRLLSFLK